MIITNDDAGLQGKIHATNHDVAYFTPDNPPEGSAILKAISEIDERTEQISKALEDLDNRLKLVRSNEPREIVEKPGKDIKGTSSPLLKNLAEHVNDLEALEERIHEIKISLEV